MTQAVDPSRCDVLIYHNPACGTSRNVLALIRNAGIEPHVIEYLNAPPNSSLLCRLAQRAGTDIRGLLREKDTPYAALGLADPALTEEALLQAIAAHPILLQRPLVVSPLGVALCRPSERVLDLLPFPQLGALSKEDGEQVVDAQGQRIGKSA